MRTTVKAIVSAALLSLICVAAFSQQVAKSIPNSTSPDGLIGFLQFTPSDYGSQKHPLIIFLHGIGERGNGTTQLSAVTANAIPKFCAAGATMRFTVGGQTSSFVVLSPQLSTQYGYWPTFYVTEMIKYAKANLQIDPNRIYITGLSLGGGGTWRAITETGTQNFDYSFDAGIAAAAPVCGTQEMNDGYFCQTVGANHLPIWAFHSMDDGTVAVNATQHGELIALGCGLTPPAKFTYYQSGGHAGAWINAFDTGHITVPTVVNGVVTNFTANPNLYEWFLSNTRGTTTQPVNTVPVANAGATQTITLPVSTVTLTGSGTGTNGATISSYSWTKTSGPSSGTISSANAASTTVTGLAQGTYVFTLTVTDNHGLTSSATVTETVNAAANTVPVASAGSAQTITLPTSSVTLAGSGTGTNGATISSYAWVKTSGPSSGTISSANAASTTVTGLAQGTYVFTLTVTDNHGLTSSSAVTITVNPATTSSSAPNQYPVASAGANQTITLPNTLTLDGSASKDPDGSIVSYWWTVTAGPTGSVITNRTSAITTITNLTAGTYTFVLMVTDNGGLVASASTTVVVNNATTATPPAAGNLVGYIKTSAGPSQACADASSAGRTAVYSSAIANGSILYTDAAMTKVYNGGWNWYSCTATLGGATSYAFAVYPDGTIHLLSACSATTTTTPPANTANLLGYIKTSAGPYQACADASSTGRIAIYGSGIANGSILYTDAAKTQIYNGGWNWYSFTPALGGTTSYAFAVYPTGGILLLRNCATGAAMRGVAPATTAEEDIATLQRLKDSAMLTATANKLSMYPNPVHTTATIELNSSSDGNKTINVYNTSGVLKAKYTWQTIKGYNVFSLKDVQALASGLYIIEIRDNNGKSVGSIKFLKM